MSDSMGDSSHRGASTMAGSTTGAGLASRIKRAIIGALPMRKEVDLPTYERDRRGVVKRWDERDILFARKDLLTG